jgi:hypothetical protein
LRINSYHQNDGIGMGNSLSPMVNNVFMEHFEEIALAAVGHKPTKWLRYIDNTFVVWPCGPARLQQFIHNLNSLRPIIKLTKGLEADNTVLFLDFLSVIVTKQE